MFPDTGPTARALLALEALQSSGQVTAAELAARLGVSERAARRSVDTLRQVGIPVVSVRGRAGGYRLGRGLRLPPLVFSATEALGLVMAVLDGHHAADDPAQPVGAALGKLITALPDAVSTQAALMREHARASPDRQAARPDPDLTAALVSAVAEQRAVDLEYESPHRSWSARVDPWAVVVRHGRWYLLCWSHRAQGVRTYRIDRVLTVTETDERFVLPENLDAVSMLEEHLGTGWPHRTEVIFDAPTAQVAPFVGAAWGHLVPHPQDPDRCVLTGTTNNPDMYVAERLAGVPFDVTVVGGPELRAAMERLLARLSRSLEPR